jgi:hypothetical protein
MASEPPKVFISYSLDSPEHAQHVLRLAERLRKDGVDAQLDQYVAGTPPRGRPRWMNDQLDSAEFILVVYTETYLRRFLGREEPGIGKGADWEGSLITLELYDDRSDMSKFVPVFLDPKDASFIPRPWRFGTRRIAFANFVAIFWSKRDWDLKPSSSVSFCSSLFLSLSGRVCGAES